MMAKKNVTSSLTLKKYILWGTSVTVIDIRLPGLEFRIRCLEGSVTSFITPFSGGSPDSGQHIILCVHKWPKPPLIRVFGSLTN